MRIVEIIICGGAVQDVVCPHGIKVIIRDYDVEGGDLNGPHIRIDPEGDPYQEMTFIHEKKTRSKHPSPPQQQ